MPRYYFNLYDDDVTVDEEGKELPDLETAHTHALENVRAIACEELREGYLHLAHRIDVLDEQGRLALTVTFRESFTLEE
ncbi:DUF6894 family protein [Sphingosinicella rhizophila]|uniref:DUF6894 domain-containing protein n=1 Tax=Sphingosinicella rhizophila TaxID=3050082 RepID=A0ABU3Q7D4_9SPHN|nr:hypothetical protein [Sphingosinicella sp. GR2756]MDT9599296.1 hypothetical protein [Sphingosinicella sp. GR2756]